MTDHRDEHETYGHTHSRVIEDLRKQVATLLDEQTGFRVAIAELQAARRELERLRALPRPEDIPVAEAAMQAAEARAQDAERWQADALRLLNERNTAERERDEARREVCRWAAARHRSEFRHYSTVNAIDYAEKRGWRDAWREGKE